MKCRVYRGSVGEQNIILDPNWRGTPQIDVCNDSITQRLFSYPPQMQSSIPVGNYNQFLYATLTALSQYLVASILSSFVLNWYESQLRLLDEWLKKRPPFSLHGEQLTAVNTLLEVGKATVRGLNVATLHPPSFSPFPVQTTLTIHFFPTSHGCIGRVGGPGISPLPSLNFPPLEKFKICIVSYSKLENVSYSCMTL